MFDHEDNGMNKVRVNKGDLLATMKKNKEKHVITFRAAYEGYVKEATVKLEQMAALARDRKEVIRRLDLVEPKSHEDEYGRVIAMLEMSMDETITISATEFDQFVRDKWAWKKDFMDAFLSYSSQE